MHLIGYSQSSVQSETSSLGAHVGKDEFKMSDMKNLQEQSVIWKKGRNLNESVINEQESKR